MRDESHGVYLAGEVSGWDLAGMEKQAFFLVVRILFAGLFLAIALAGVYLVKHQARLFGVDPAMPSETGSSRTYSKLQVFVIWAHALFLTAAFALMLH